MDPLSLVAGTIAILQAGDRLAQLVGKMEEFNNAEENMKTLDFEVGNLSTLLETLQASTQKSISTKWHSPALHSSIRASLLYANRLQSIISRCMPKLPDSQTSQKSPRVRRLSWMRKKTHIEATKQALRDSLFIVQMHVLHMNLNKQEEMTLSISSLSTKLSNRSPNAMMYLEEESYTQKMDYDPATSNLNIQYMS